MEKIEKNFNSVKRRIGFTTSISYVKYDYYFQDDNDMRNIYSLTIKRNGKTSSFRFGDSVFNSQNVKRPKDYEIMYALVQDYYSYYDYVNLRDFMSMYGYEDKEKARKIVNRLKRDFEKLNKLFTTEEIELIARVYQENNY